MKRLIRNASALVALGFLLSACAGPKPKPDTSTSAATEQGLSGLASWYGGRWHGRKTANGERYNQWSMTAAHRTLPFNTWVRVTRADSGESVLVRINNRGPYKNGRVIDLSKAAARKLGSEKMGLARVTLEVVPAPEAPQRAMAMDRAAKPASATN